MIAKLIAVHSINLSAERMECATFDNFLKGGSGGIDELQTSKFDDAEGQNDSRQS